MCLHSTLPVSFLRPSIESLGQKCTLSLGDDDDEDNDDDEVTILKYGTASTTNAWFE